MAKSTSLANSILALLYNATAIADVAENDATSPTTVTGVSLHTATPTAGSGSQTENETAYTNYVRQSVARTTGGWTAPASGATSNVALIQFPQCGVTGATLTHVGVGKSASGAGVMWHFGALNASLAVANLIQPQFGIGALTITES